MTADKVVTGSDAQPPLRTKGGDKWRDRLRMHTEWGILNWWVRGEASTQSKQNDRNAQTQRTISNARVSVLQKSVVIKAAAVISRAMSERDTYQLLLVVSFSSLSTENGAKYKRKDSGAATLVATVYVLNSQNNKTASASSLGTMHRLLATENCTRAVFTYRHTVRRLTTDTSLQPWSTTQCPPVLSWAVLKIAINSGDWKTLK
jgi:hypothetical protein